jgi:hypothetical protein
MTITFYPRRLLLTAALIIGLAAILSLASSGTRYGVLGMAGAVAYLLFDIFFAVNPAIWRRGRR